MHSSFKIPQIEGLNGLARPGQRPEFWANNEWAQTVCISTSYQNMSLLFIEINNDSEEMKMKKDCITWT